MNLLKRYFGDEPKQALAWSFYDFANSAYAVIILSFVFPIYFKEVIVGSNLGDFYWGLILAISLLLGGLAAPVIGAIADYDNRKKPKFVAFTLVCILATAMLFFTGPGTIFWAAVIFIIANFSLEVVLPIYDSFLGWVSKKHNSGRISGFAWGLGYLGGVAAILLLRPFYINGYGGDFDTFYRLTFVFTALFFLIFALPSFFYVVEYKRESRKESYINLAKIGFRKVLNTIRNLREHKPIALFLLGFYFFSDAIGTIFAYMPIYARSTFGLSFGEIAALLLVVQVFAFPASALIGQLSDRFGSKKILLTTLAGWVVIVILLALVRDKDWFYFIAVLTSLVIGSSQSVARSWLSKLVPGEKRFEFFGFNSFASKIAATLGPLLFGIISVTTGSQRIAIASLIPLFLLAIWIFSKIKEDDEQEVSAIL